MDIFRKEYKPLTDAQKGEIESIKDLAGQLYTEIDLMIDCREKSIAKTKLEEVVMWAVKGVTA